MMFVREISAYLLSMSLVAGVGFLPSRAAAQNVEDEIGAALGDEPAKAEPKKAAKITASETPAPAPVAASPAAVAEEKAAAEPLPEIGQDRLAVFVLRRGFYTAADLGVGMTFGGVRGYSNVQPYVAVRLGFDIGNYVSLEAAFASVYASGNALSNNDAPAAGGQEVQNYGMFMMGADVVGAFRATERFEIQPKLGGGMCRIDPQPTSPSDLNATVNAMNPYVGGGVDFKYLTLLTDFSAGLSTTFYYVLGPNIPALGLGFAVRYTF